MYNTSDTYKTAMSGNLIRSRVSGTIKLTSGSTVTIDDSSIISGSLSINNKAVNNSDFNLGAVYVGEMSVTLYNSAIDRYKLYGSEVTLDYYLITDSGEEKVPLGKWYVDTPTRTKKLIQLKCYDAMTKFDIETVEDTFGTPSEMLKYVCNKCGVELGMTEDQINAMCNPTANVSLMMSKVGTYRDFLSYLAMVMGGFATINRSGQLEIRQFHTSADLTIPARKRTDSTVHDYQTFFKSVTARFIAESNFYPYTETDETIDSGLQLDLGDIPIIQGLEEFKHTVLQNILTYLKTLKYTPTELKMISDPSVDLGDGLNLTNINNTDNSAFVIVTGFDWTYHSDESISCVGQDALLPNVSDSSKRQLDFMEAVIESKNLVVKTYTNSGQIHLKSTDTNIIIMGWSCFEDTTAIFIATIPVTMEKDGNIVLTCKKGTDTNQILTSYLEKGSHIVTISNYINCSASEQVTWIVSGHCEYYESDIRIEQAHHASVKDWIDNQTIKVTQDSSGNNVYSFGYDYVEQATDKTVPSGTIAEQSVKATVLAQGMNATVAWDGTLELEDTVDPITLDGITVSTVTDKLVSMVQKPIDKSSGISDVVSAITLDGIDVVGITDEVVFSHVIQQQTITFGLNDLTEYDSDGKISMKTTFIYSSNEGTIDTGKMTVLKIDTSDKQSVEGIEVKKV